MFEHGLTTLGGGVLVSGLTRVKVVEIVFIEVGALSFFAGQGDWKLFSRD